MNDKNNVNVQDWLTNYVEYITEHSTNLYQVINYHSAGYSDIVELYLELIGKRYITKIVSVHLKDMNKKEIKTINGNIVRLKVML